jgi:acyl carrier protein
VVREWSAKPLIVGSNPTLASMAYIGKLYIRSKIYERLEYLGIDISTVTDTDDLVNIGLDSLDLVELVMWAEKVFGIQIPDDEAEQLRNIGQSVNYIHKAVNPTLTFPFEVKDERFTW